MFHDEKNFELCRAKIEEVRREEDTYVFVCPYMLHETAYLRFFNVKEEKDYTGFVGKEICYIGPGDHCFEIHFMPGDDEAAVVPASTYEIRWK